MRSVTTATGIRTTVAGCCDICLLFAGAHHLAPVRTWSLLEFATADGRVTGLIGTVLSAAGHDVFEACNGEEAWQTLQRVQAPLVILDWMMPVMDGLELLRRIRGSGHLRDTFVMMITGRGTPQDVLEALEAGADDFATKPMTSDRLRARVIVAERHIQQCTEARRVEEALQRAKWLAGVGEAVVTGLGAALGGMLGGGVGLITGIIVGRRPVEGWQPVSVRNSP